MPELIGKSALDGPAPITAGGVTLSEVSAGPISSIAIFPGGGKVVAKALKSIGLSFPAPNCWTAAGDAKIIWSGRDQAFLVGVAAKAVDGAALTDQSGGWATLSVAGPSAVDALIRLVPLDLRLTAFPVGRAVRVPLNHMSIVLLRVGDQAFEIMVFRSMATTAWHEILVAMQALEARAVLKP